MAQPARILVVDRDRVALKNLEHILGKEGHAVSTAPGGMAALKLLEARSGEACAFDAILADLSLDTLDETRFLRQCLHQLPATEIILISDKMSVTSVVDAIRRGAFHYLVKPVRLNELRQTVGLAVESSRHKQEQQGLRQELEEHHARLPLITRDPGMMRLLEQARRVAAMELPVLITGATGTGKEILARHLHDASPRSQRPFVAVNCGAFQEELLVNELFGHGREAYTGAMRDRKGLVETAHGGTLFLDEITEMSLAMQVKLLRVIQEKELRKLGVTTPISVDVRFIAATNRPIQEEVEAGRFRRDLFYRLNVIDLHLPPLAQRKGDIAILVRHFLDKYAPRINPRVTGIDREALALLEAHPFQGNVRELENLIQRAIAFASGSDITVEDLPDILRDRPDPLFRHPGPRLLTLEEMEREYVLWVCQELHGNQTLAAQALGLDRVSLWRRLKKIHASHPESRDPGEAPAPDSPS